MPIEGVGTIFLPVSRCREGFFVNLLIDSGANECFVDTAFAEQKGLKMIKTKEKVNIHLADGTACVYNWIVK